MSRFNIQSPELIRVLSENPDFVLPNQLDKLPRTKVTRLATTRALSTIEAPGESSGKDMSFGSFACARVVSNYPLQAGRPYREGDPICDRLSVQLFENRVVAALADGCNWGPMPRKAAKRACKAYREFISEHHRAITSIKAAGTVICAALATAHNAIQEGAPELGPDPGTTTICAGLLLEIDYDLGVSGGSDVSSAAAAAALASDWDGSPFVWVFASLGDCKCFHYSKQTREVTDLTAGNRSGLLDPTDPGGRIGGRGAPRIGNFVVDHKPCEEGDLVMIMSDGVHDNLDPVQRGKEPSYFQEECDDWAAVGPLRTARLQAQYMEDFISKKIIGETEEPTCELVTNGLIDNSITTTASSREFLECHPKEKLEVNYTKFPGKLDHASCLTFRASKVTLSYDEWMGNSFVATSSQDRANMTAALQDRERQLTWRTDAIVRSPDASQRTSANSARLSSETTEVTELDFGDLDAADVFAEEDIVEAVRNLRRITLTKDQLAPVAPVLPLDEP